MFADQVLDEQRGQFDTTDEYASDAEAQAEGFASKHKGNAHWRDFHAELTDEANREFRVEARLVEDLATEGLTKQDLYDLADEYDRLNEELWEMFGVE